MQRRTLARHSRNAHDVIRALARQTARPVDEVASVYASELARLRADAKLDAYLDVLAERRAREILLRS